MSIAHDFRSVTLLVLLCGCGGAVDRNDSGAMKAGAEPSPSGTAIDGSTALLAAGQADSVWLVPTDSGARLRWWRAAARQSWESGNLLSASPRVTLRTIDSDSQSDLFYAIEFDEFIFGVLLLARGDSVHQAYRTATALCRAPALEDANGDGRLDVIEYLPSALDSEECKGDPYGSICHEALPTDWPSVWLQRDSGAFTPDSVGAPQYYRARAGEFDDAGQRLKRDLQDSTGLARASPRCNEAMAKALSAMARRARSLGAGPP